MPPSPLLPKEERQRPFRCLTETPVSGERGRDWHRGQTLSPGPLPDHLSCSLAGMVLGTLFIGGSLVAGQQLTGGDLMSFLVASQTVQR